MLEDDKINQLGVHSPVVFLEEELSIVGYREQTIPDYWSLSTLMFQIKLTKLQQFSDIRILEQSFLHVGVNFAIT